MQSLVLTPDGLRLADTPMPPLLPGEVRIEVRSVGISATDIAVWDGRLKVEQPVVPGHQVAGVVHESTDPSLTPGTPVATQGDIGCGTCWYCTDGKMHLCRKRRTLGVDRDGGLAEYVSVPAEAVHVLPEGVDSKAATFMTPLACAIAIAENVPAQEDEPVLIVGCKEEGLLTAQVYDAFGAQVYIVDSNKYRLGTAKKIGLTNVIPMERVGWMRRIFDIADGVGCRVVVNTLGSHLGMNASLEAVRNGGTIVLNGFHTYALPMDSAEVIGREIVLWGVRGGPYDEALGMLSKGRIEVRQIVSASFGLDEGVKAFEKASDPTVTKVVIDI